MVSAATPSAATLALVEEGGSLAFTSEEARRLAFPTTFRLALRSDRVGGDKRCVLAEEE